MFMELGIHNLSKRREGTVL